jgi:hypothetical protein
MLLASIINGSALLTVLRSEWVPHKGFHSQMLPEYRRKSSITQGRLLLRHRPSRESIQRLSALTPKWALQQDGGFRESTTVIRGPITPSINRLLTISMIVRR